MGIKYDITLPGVIDSFANDVRFQCLWRTSLAKDVQHFLSNAEMCQHLAGEWDSSLPEEDKKVIEKGINTWCAPAKKALPGLREKYKENKEIIKKLSEYDF